MMNKREFLKELSYRLNGLSASDRDDLIQYYDELIEDKKERTGQSEEVIISSLGSTDDIIRKATGIRNEKIIIDDPEIVASSPKSTSKKKENDNNTILKIVIIVLTFPLWFGLGAGVIGCIIGFFAAGIGIGVGGIACIIRGFFVLSSSIGEFVLYLGCGCILIGLSLIIVPSLIKLFTFLFREIKSFIEKVI